MSWEESMKQESTERRTGRQAIQEWLTDKLAATLELSPDVIDVRDSFHHYGLSSADAVLLSGELEEWLGRKLSPTLAYEYPSIDSLAGFLSGEAARAPESSSFHAQGDTMNDPIAVVGMACRFPGASDLNAFWRLLRDGVDAISEVPADRWDAWSLYEPEAGVPGKMNTRWGGFLDQVNQFDSSFFGISSREADGMDPQQRILMEMVSDALEDAGIAADRLAGSSTGVFIGISNNEYGRLQYNHPSVVDAYASTSSAMSIAANRISYTFDLRGPSLAIDTACSSSLVAAHIACQSIRSGESAVAIVGGVNVILSPETTIAFSLAGALASDGRCKSFDSRADGYTRGEGAGVIVLKPLRQAIENKDRIYAVIRGSAVNQGGRTNGLTAPSRQAQETVLREACRNAGVLPAELQYVEAHGTGTPLGDRIELAALGAVLKEGRASDDLCSIGSVKSSIGHLEPAAGMAGLIKVVLSIQHREIPPSLHFKNPNPHICFEQLPLRVQQTLGEWPQKGQKRLAGVSSFGFGGTNSHVIVEEWLPGEDSGPTRPWQLLSLSAKTASALDAVTANLAGYLARNPSVHLGDVAYTLQVGRTAYDCRRIAVCKDVADAQAALAACDPERIFSRERDVFGSLVFMFSGLGDHHINMARELYEREPAFRDDVDECSRLLLDPIGADLREILYPAEAPARDSRSGPAEDNNLLRRLLGHAVNGEDPRFSKLNQTAVSQPAVFVIEYALARLMMRWGVRPEAMIGYSLGEYVAACIAGVFSLEDALFVVAHRARMIQQLPPGAMLAVSLPQDQLQPLLPEELCIAAVNTPSVCVVAGPAQAVRDFEIRSAAEGLICHGVQAVHAFHSGMMESLVPEFTELVSRVKLNWPQIPFISNVTGVWAEADDVTQPSYWARHLRQTVRFEQGIRELLQKDNRIFLEVGPGQTLCSMVNQHPGNGSARQVFSCLPYFQRQQSELAFLLGTLGKLWLAGASLDWDSFYENERRQRLRLPTYPFERQRHWFSPRPEAGRAAETQPPSLKKADPAQWFYELCWGTSAHAPAVHDRNKQKDSWLIFLDENSLGVRVTQSLRETATDVVTVRAGEGFEAINQREYIIDPRRAGDYKQLFSSLRSCGKMPSRVAHLWNVSAAGQPLSGSEDFDRHQVLGFESLVHIAQAWGSFDGSGNLEITIVSNQLQRVNENDPVCPAKATLLGAVRVIPQECQNIRCTSVDIPPPGTEQAAVDQLLMELEMASSDPVVAYREGQRLIQRFGAVILDKPEHPSRLRDRGTYLLTGGLGGIGLLIAEYLTRAVKARIVLTGRSSFPERHQWDGWLADHGPEDGVSRKIQRLRAIEREGAEVLVLSADVSNAREMEAALKAAEEQFGDIHGIIHAAGVVAADAFVPVQELQSADCERHFSPKIRGLYTLEKLCEKRRPDFVVLLSSISSLLGGLGFAAYCAANTFMDSFAQQKSSSGRGVWTSINLETWLTGAAEAKVPARSAVAEFAMTKEEGVQAFQRILSAQPVAQIVMSTGDLERRVAAQSASRALASGTAVPAAKQNRTLRNAFIPASNNVERAIVAIWQEFLGIKEVGIHDNFFDIGGNSLIGLQIVRSLQQKLKVQLTPVALFEAPTASALAQYIMSKIGGNSLEAGTGKTERRIEQRRSGSQEIAIIAMNGRFPGARNVDEFWQNLIDKVESVSFFTDGELIANGVGREMLNDSRYVKARPVIAGVDQFDCRFFKFSPREADLTDPQQRIFLECAWEAMELAGYSSENYDGLVGVFAGTSMSTYLFGNPEFARTLSPYQVVAGNDKDSLATSTSYRLNLRGPSITVQTHCSTSLVATHLACQSLLNGECDMALAGGVSIRVPQKMGYLYEPGGQDSPDGHTRSFDRKARGTVLGDGVGIVVLKRLEDALADGDRIYAVIKGSAINNDGDLKVCFVAPSVEGQSQAVRSALARSGVDPRTIGYVEAHGSATEIGDPIEVTALAKAFREWTSDKQFCWIGSAKSNVGHLDKAAGVTGLIKATLALHHKLIPPSLNFEEANQSIDFENSPFSVATELTEWKRGDTPLRAGVNSLGMGGTNAHLVLEEAPPDRASSPSRLWQVLPLSARSDAALEVATANLTAYLKTHPVSDLADVAYTLQVGRATFAHRQVLVCQGHQDAIEILENKNPGRILSAAQENRNRIVTFVLPGVGDHYEGMARDLYHNEPIFRHEMDRCAEILRRYSAPDILAILYPAKKHEQNGKAVGFDLRKALRPSRPADTGSISGLYRTSSAQPVVFAVEYSLAKLLMSWGIVPQALIGYSLGEFVAATIAGSLSLEDALRLVNSRAQLIDKLAPGAMLSVPLSLKEIEPLMGQGLSIAISNGPDLYVVSGPVEAIAELESELERRAIVSRRLPTTHAFHSRMMEPARAEVENLVRSIALKEPQIGWISNVTGTWIKAEEALDPLYWARHMCQTVRFSEGLETLLKEKDRVFIEVGPGQNLGSFIRQHPGFDPHGGQIVVSAMRNSYENQSDQHFLLEGMARLWLAGVKINWLGFYAGEKRRRLRLPTYPFERERHWLESNPPARESAGRMPAGLEQIGELARQPIGNSFYLPSWKQVSPRALDWPDENEEKTACWLLFVDKSWLSSGLVRELELHQQRIIQVAADACFRKSDEYHYAIRPEVPGDYDALMKEIEARGWNPTRVVHLWTVGISPEAGLEGVLKSGIYSLLFIAQAMERIHRARCDISIVTSGMQAVTGLERIQAAKATLLGPCRIIPVEYQNMNCRCIDVNLAAELSWEEELQCKNLAAELSAAISDHVVALRAHQRWVESMEPVVLPEEKPQPAGRRPWPRTNGVYLVTGGLGGIGMAMAERLAQSGPVKLVLLGRTGLPPREDWDQVIASEKAAIEGSAAGKIQKVRQLEAMGAEIMVAAADVADEEQLRAVVKEAVKRYGTVHGVIHAAGVPGVGLSQLKRPDMLARVLAPKVHGTLALEKTLAEEGIELDFFVLFSSVASIIGGGPGQFDYCAANAFLDAFAKSQAHSRRRTVSINWCEWQWNAWTEGLTTVSEEIRKYLTATREKFGITMDEGWEALGRILPASLPQVVVSTQDFHKLFETSKTLSAESFNGKLEGGRAVAPRHRRPDLTVPFEAAGSKMEMLVAEAWEEFLGVSPVGIHDNFFELGGNSLIAMQILARLRQIWGMDLPLSSMLTSPTITGQAIVAESSLIEKLECLSEEEAQSLI